MTKKSIAKNNERLQGRLSTIFKGELECRGINSSTNRLLCIENNNDIQFNIYKNIFLKKQENILKIGLTVEQVVEGTGLTKEEVEKIQKEIQAKSKQVQRFSLFCYISTYYEKANVVTIVVLAILAAISLSAVIGEDGIIFQAKDTKNMIENETQYDSEQLASMQGDLRDNSIYSGIGLVPGTDLGGSSEGGEHGSGGSGNTGGNGGNTHGGSTTGGGGGATTGGMLGEEAVPPTITVLEGEEIAASFFRSDVTVQIATIDKTLKIKYVLTTTVDEISKELYPSGLVREMDIENGGTLTFTRAGEYTITAATYDLEGRKSNSTIMWLKIDKGGITGAAGVEVTYSNGIEGANGWYTSNVTYRVLGTDTGSSRVTYRVRGVAYDNGYIGGREINAGPEHNATIDTGEVDIPNGTTFRIAVDGEFTITAYTYDAGGSRLSTSPVVNMKRDATRPFITRYTGEQVTGSGFRVDVDATDYASKLTAGNSYTYRHKEAMDLGEYTKVESNQATKTYTGLAQNKTYDMYVAVIDQAGNIAASDVISKPSLWVSIGTAGETYIEGTRSYYRSDVQLKMRGQDSNNVDISKVTYEISGTTTGEGSVGERAGLSSGTAISGEVDINDMTAIKTVTLAADGNWTVKINTYNKENQKVSTNTLEVTRDTVPPQVTEFRAKFSRINTVKANSVLANDVTSPLSKYKYYLGSTNIAISDIILPYEIQTGSSENFSVTAVDKAGNESQKFLGSIENVTLSSMVTVGDFVYYNAGTWSAGTLTGTANGQSWSGKSDGDSLNEFIFRGWTNGADKGTNIISGTSVQGGWRVLDIDNLGRVSLISSGVVCNYTIICPSSKSHIHKAVIDDFCNKTFCNSAAEFARGITKAENDKLNYTSLTTGKRWKTGIWQ